MQAATIVTEAWVTDDTECPTYVHSTWLTVRSNENNSWTICFYRTPH